jgi:GDP-L-fucose synthase
MSYILDFEEGDILLPRVLLTGRSGMVGRNFLEHPSISGFEVIAPNSLELNLLDFAQTLRFLVKYKPDIIIHAAGRVGGIQANIREPVRMLVDNLDMGRNLVLAAHDVGVHKLLFLGSSCMYPRETEQPMREENILNGALEETNEGYSLAKITVMRLCQYLNREGVQYKTIIPANLYGRYDNFDPSRSHLVAATIDKIHRAKDDVEIWGDGRAQREFLYAGDLADMLVRAVTHFDTLPEVMNVGTGVGCTVNELYGAVARVVGYTGRFHHDLSKPVGMMRKTVDVSKQKEWGWMPKTSLDDGLIQAYASYLQ